MNLTAWLAHIATVHPRDMELGLERVREVAGRLGLARPAPVAFTIAGTNGKGSTVAAIEAILLRSGLRAGSYMSPHLQRFNERIRLNGEDCRDSLICAALKEVEEARGEISLSYFEFATLAALWIFTAEDLDAVILEVGLGGRLDAVNIVDADVAVITNIELDHQDWLGNTRELIGAEKAGIVRAGAPLVYGEELPPESVRQRAAELGAPIFCRESAYGAITGNGCWSWWGRGREKEWDTHKGKEWDTHNEDLDYPQLPLFAMAAALQAVHLSPLAITDAGIRAAQHDGGLPGRMELRRDAAGELPVLLDVAHNPAAARLLAGRIAELRARLGPVVNVAVVLAVLADKDIEGVAGVLEAQVDVWYISEVDDSRTAPVSELSRRLRQSLRDAEIFDAESVTEAYRKAAGSGVNLVVATGSFHTVAVVRPLTRAGAADTRQGV